LTLNIPLNGSYQLFSTSIQLVVITQAWKYKWQWRAGIIVHIPHSSLGKLLWHKTVLGW